MKPGEALIRNGIKELDERIKALDASRQRGALGPLTFRARLRWLHQDYDKLVALAQRYGYDVV